MDRQQLQLALADRRPHCRCAGWGQIRDQTSSVTYHIPRQVARFDLKSAGGDSGNRTRDRGFADRCLTTWLSRPAPCGILMPPTFLPQARIEVASP